jgi:hypothetical protein
MEIEMADEKTQPAAKKAPVNREFEVVGTRICDSTDTYRDPGDMAILDDALAQHYYALGYIKVELPENPNV